MNNFEYFDVPEDDHDSDWDDTLDRLFKESEATGIPFDHLVGMHLGGVEY